eukprot:TRINITY_DN280_c0_g1_i1.p1 TRINITY_DN280_c0_g1~~TRINITY_DN280_c0_g1_i1.p1  ORF type:complete len:264 (+),score=31.59 TRINITY_DN280_c0_g1_i1:125-916(+)
MAVVSSLCNLFSHKASYFINTFPTLSLASSKTSVFINTLPPVRQFRNTVVTPGLSFRKMHRLPTPKGFIIRASRTESTTVPLKSKVPKFKLPEPLTGKMWQLEDFETNPALLVMFICNHCPFVIHLKKDIVKLANEYIPKGVAVVAISSNSIITHPQDGPELMAQEAKTFNFPFPYLYDESQEIARAFGAACTPDFFLYRKNAQNFELAYHGQFDDSRPSNNKPITGSDLRAALDCVLSDKPVSFPQKASVGCSIKWHPNGSM